MTFVHALVLGMVEGFTEFLPISSTAHLIITSRLLGLPETEFLKSFTVAIQLGAILAVVVLYARRLLTDWEMSKRIIAAFIPTALVGLLLYQLIKGVLLESYHTVIVALFLGGVALIAFERLRRRASGEATDTEEDVRYLSYPKTVLIGCAQALAVVPGVSRAAATIVGGMLLGVSRQAIVEFSFLLAVPTMAAATGYDLLKNAGAFTLQDVHLLIVGFITSFAFALIGIRYLLGYIRRSSFTGFGVYRIIAAIAFALLLIR